ncbi:HEAT repeat domain-containing protein, partial [Amycolatopsis sp. NPDC003861]
LPLHPSPTPLPLPAALPISVAELPGDEATAALAGALDDPDPEVRRHAALASGGRGETRAVPLLVAMVVEGTNDVEAAEVLGVLAREPDQGARILEALAEELAGAPPVRMRVTQALAELPGDLAQEILQRLTGDEDRAVALLATAIRVP